MVFNWLYRKIAVGFCKVLKEDPKILQNIIELVDANILLSSVDLKPVVLKLMADPEFLSHVFSLTDEIYDVYFRKITGSIGGSLKGTVSESVSGNDLSGLPIPPQYKKLLKNPLIQLLVANFLGKRSQNEPQTSSIPAEYRIE